MIGKSFSNARLQVGGTGFSSGIFSAGAQYGLVAHGMDAGVQGNASGSAGSGVMGFGEYIGVSGTSKGNGGYALYGQQHDHDSYGLYVLGGKNYLSGPTTIGSGLEIGRANRRGGITMYDSDNGSPFCLEIKSGAVVANAGACNN